MKILCALLFSLSINYALADTWDNMSLKQAKQVAKYIKKNPFILDNCDCCGGGLSTLLKVVSTEIVPCAWKPEHYSVRVKTHKVAIVKRTDEGVLQNSEPAQFEGEYSYTISMNYTFVFDRKLDLGVPLFKVIPYDLYTEVLCYPKTMYPNPIAENSKVIDKGYHKWYRKQIGEPKQ